MNVVHLDFELRCACPHSFSVYFLQDLEDLYEEIDDIKIELDCCKNVLLCTQTGHYHLSIENNEEAEEESTTHSDRRLCQLVTKKDLHKTAKNKDEKTGIKSRADVREVSFSLECKCC